MKKLLLTTIAALTILFAQAQQCQADFSYMQNGPTTVFTDLSTMQSTNYSATWSWDFGDGNTSNQQNPVHTYSNGTYNACLIITFLDSVSMSTCISTYCDSIFIGNDPTTSTSNAEKNIAIGTTALDSITQGDYNIAIGDYSIYSINGGDLNTGFGKNSLYSTTSGIGNIGMGSYSGDNITSGSYNIMLGYDIDAPSATSSNQLNIGNLIYGTDLDGDYINDEFYYYNTAERRLFVGARYQF